MPGHISEDGLSPIRPPSAPTQGRGPFCIQPCRPLPPLQAGIRTTHYIQKTAVLCSKEHSTAVLYRPLVRHACPDLCRPKDAAASSGISSQPLSASAKCGGLRDSRPPSPEPQTGASLQDRARFLPLPPAPAADQLLPSPATPASGRKFASQSPLFRTAIPCRHPRKVRSMPLLRRQAPKQAMVCSGTVFLSSATAPPSLHRTSLHGPAPSQGTGRPPIAFLLKQWGGRRSRWPPFGACAAKNRPRTAVQLKGG